MRLQSKSDPDTREIGRRLGEKLKPGDVVCLFGDLGAGKTTMVKGIASAQGIEDRDITSASFTIIAEYDTPVPFYHIDLYRVTADEVADLGLYEYFGADGICVIEWAERAENEIPENSIKVKLIYTEDDCRDIELTGVTI
jgi:tRNA threonylcarbamoyladenosine biosynthesis protein TsaE